MSDWVWKMLYQPDDKENWPAKVTHAEDGQEGGQGALGRTGSTLLIEGAGGHAQCAGHTYTTSCLCVCTRGLCETLCASVSFYVLFIYK